MNRTRVGCHCYFKNHFSMWEYRCLRCERRTILKELTAPLSQIAIYPCIHRTELDSPEPKQWAGDTKKHGLPGARVPAGTRVGETESQTNGSQLLIAQWHQKSWSHYVSSNVNEDEHTNRIKQNQSRHGMKSSLQDDYKRRLHSFCQEFWQSVLQLKTHEMVDYHDLVCNGVLRILPQWLFTVWF